MMLGKLDSYMQKNETVSLSYTIHKYKFKMDERLKRETGIHQNHRGEHRQQPLRPQSQQLLPGHVSEAKGNECKNELLGLHQDKKLLHSKGNSNKTKRQPAEWEKTFANDITDKALVSKICNELLNLNTQKINNPVKKWAEHINRLHQRSHTNGQQTNGKNAQHQQASGKFKSKPH